jgi:ssDNA-binding Zn-finger/Zn-ribbon topoisomerase 1
MMGHNPQTAITEHPMNSKDQLNRLDWYQFEKLMALVFEQQGFSVQRHGGAKADGGVDLVITKGQEQTVVQCKHWKAQDVGVRHIREFLGTLTDVGSPKGIFITSKDFTEDARALAHKHNIQIFGERETLRMLEEVNWKCNPAILGALDHNKKICPRCDSRMELKTAKRGASFGKQFWGCSDFPRCRYVLEHSEEQVFSDAQKITLQGHDLRVGHGSPAKLPSQGRSNLDPKAVAFLCWTMTFLVLVGVCTGLVMQIGNVFIGLVPSLKANVVGYSMLIGLAMGTAAFLELKRAFRRRR